MALEALPSVVAAYVNKELEIQLAEDIELDESSVKNALAEHKIKVVSVRKL